MEPKLFRFDSFLNRNIMDGSERDRSRTDTQQSRVGSESDRGVREGGGRERPNNT